MDKKYIPFDKSWIIRMGILDMVHGYDDINTFLSKQKYLGDDLRALKRSAIDWEKDIPVDVGESGTLYRLLKFASWKLHLNKKFITQGTLKNRKINDDSSLVSLSQIDLLKIDNGTSQWASAAALLGDTERLVNPPFKLALTYEAIEHWNKCRRSGHSWVANFDQTIARQAEVYMKLLKGERSRFIPEQAEDFCFAYIFNYMSANEGEKLWPALRGHESDRIIEVQNTLNCALKNMPITSKDHRVVQAIAMWAKVNKRNIHILYPESVSKSWPQFWDFLNS